jgi:hypothetical protein
MIVSDMLAGGGDNGILGNITEPMIAAESIGSHSTCETELLQDLYSHANQD